MHGHLNVKKGCTFLYYVKLKYNYRCTWAYVKLFYFSGIR